MLPTMAERQAFLNRSSGEVSFEIMLFARGTTFRAFLLLSCFFCLYGSGLPVIFRISRSRFVPKSAGLAVGLNSSAKNRRIADRVLNWRAVSSVASWICR